MGYIRLCSGSILGFDVLEGFFYGTFFWAPLTLVGSAVWASLLYIMVSRFGAHTKGP